MNKVTFNLKKSLTKQANYDGGKGLIAPLTRAFQNCQKAKREGGLEAQAAWYSCLAEFQKHGGNEWTLKYAGHPSEPSKK